MKLITQGLITDYKNARIKADVLQDKIVKRLDYIVATIFKTFKVKKYTWYFIDAAEGEVGTFTYDEPEIYMAWEYDKGMMTDDMIIIDRDGEEYMFDGSIPTRWLFENFETELTKGKKKYDDREAAHIAASLSDKKATKKLTDMAKKKLSKEELAALKQSL
jgi:hypothetical protein